MTIICFVQSAPINSATVNVNDQQGADKLFSR